MYNRINIEILSGKPFTLIIHILSLFRLYIVLIIIFNIYLATSLSIRSYYIKQIINYTFVYNNYLLFNPFIPITIYIVFSLINILCMRLNEYTQYIILAPKITKITISRIVERIVFSSNSFMTYEKNEILIESITDMIDSIPDTISIIFNRFVYLFFLVLAGILILSFTRLIFAFILLLWIILVLYVIRYSYKKISKIIEQTNEYKLSFIHYSLDVLKNIITVKLNNFETNETINISKKLDKFIISQKKTAKQYLWMWSIYGCSFIVVLCINFYLLIEYQKRDSISAGDFALVITINLIVFDNFWTLFRDLLSFMKSIGQIKQSLEKIDRYTKKNIEYHHHNIDSEPQLHISYKDVCLSINNRVILDNITTSIASGTKVGIIGNSGSGKSSFVNLLLRIYEPTKGVVLLSENNITEIKKDLLNNQICYIASNMYLFDRSVKENIAYGSRNTTLEQIYSAAKLVEAHDFIIKMKNSYNTILNSNGIMLSAGQRQRILLARAVLKKSNITILDEATAHIDEATELKIMHNIVDILKGKTLIVISHRFSSLYYADKILLFKNGQIFKEYSYQEFLKCEFYI